MILSDNERKVLKALMRADDYCGFCYLNFWAISTKTKLNRKDVRRACRSLTRKGLAEFGKGLFTEDGALAGSGYAATPQARAAA